MEKVVSEVNAHIEMASMAKAVKQRNVVLWLRISLEWKVWLGRDGRFS